VQHEFFHRYTADEHTLRCVEKLDELLFTTNPKLTRYGEIFRHIGDAAVLYLAMLLHDTGKAANTKRHEEASALDAQRVCRRLQLAPARKKMLITLVSDHGEMSALARTRNVEDPATVAECADIVRDPDVLDALMLITLADGMGTSDEGWSDWKEQMVWQLYHQTKAYLADSVGFLEERAHRREELHREAARQLPPDFEEELDAHFAGMEERYFLGNDMPSIVRHIRLFRRFFSEGLGREGPNLDASVEWIDHPEAGHAEVLVCGWDRERLLERIAAAFLESGINILGADINTRADGLVLDVFRVSNHRNEPLPKQRDRDRFEARLSELLALPGSRALPRPARPTRPGREGDDEELPVWVVVNNNAHPDSTILELQAPDKLGLSTICSVRSRTGVSRSSRRASPRKAARRWTSFTWRTGTGPRSPTGPISCDSSAGSARRSGWRGKQHEGAVDSPTLLEGRRQAAVGEPRATAAGILSIALGVAVFLAVTIANRGAVGSFRNAFAMVTGRADLEIRGRIREEILPRVLATPGVAGATPLVEVVVTLPGFPGESLRLEGIDPFTAAGLLVFDLPAGGTRQPGRPDRLALR